MATVKREIDLLAANALVRHWARYFGVTPPRIRLARINQLHDYYRYGVRTIFLRVKDGITSWTVDNSLLHEFAHHLAHMRYGHTPKMHHGPEFKAALLAVVSYHYGDEIDQYQWAKEYTSIRKLRDVAANRVVEARARAEE